MNALANNLSPLMDIPIPPAIARLPKAGIDIHAETEARLARILTREQGTSPIPPATSGARSSFPRV